MQIDDNYRNANDEGKELLQQARSYIGKYARMKVAPNTRMGIIEDARLYHGRVEYLFHHDQRFEDKLPNFYICQDDFETCDRPTDEYVLAINQIIRYGS